MPDKGSDKIKRLTKLKPVKAHKKLEMGSERPDRSPRGLSAVKGPPRNKG
jgi:hypothetical protein